MQKKSLLNKINFQGFKSELFVSVTAKLLLLIVLILVVFLFAPSVSAQAVDVGLTEVGDNIGLGTSDLRVTIARIIRIFLSLLGIVAVVIILYGGFTYMVSAGNPEKVEKAKKVLINGVIGMAIILLSFGITHLIFNVILGGSLGTGGGGGGRDPYGGGGGALGAGIIESHYPGRNATDIPRNTSIVITFKEAMCVSSLVTDGELNVDNIEIFPDHDPEGLVTEVTASFTDDHKTFVLKPVDYLGTPEEPILYRVNLKNSITKAGCANNAFNVSGGYFWKFTVSTIVDLTPPEITTVIPRPVPNPGSVSEDDKIYRNTVIQINFNEAINPLTIRGIAQINGGGTIGDTLTSTSYNIINVKTASDDYVAGEFYYSNQYKTVEFVTNDSCGENSCGGTVYCLPGDELLSVLVKAGALKETGKPSSEFPYNGIVDMAENSLNGNLDDTSQGQADQYNLNIASGGGDNVYWQFQTNNNVDLEAPEIENYYPDADQAGIDPDADFSILFTKILMSSTVKSDSGYNDGKEYITLNQPDTPEDRLSGYWLSKNNDNDKTLVTIRHSGLGEDLKYGLTVGSGLKDIRQNCYKPCSGPGCVRSGIQGVYSEVGDWPGEYPSCDLKPII